MMNLSRSYCSYCRSAPRSHSGDFCSVEAFFPVLSVPLKPFSVSLSHSLSFSQHMIFEPTSVGDTSCDCLALLAALDQQGFQGQLQGAVSAQQQRAHTLGLQQDTLAEVHSMARSRLSSCGNSLAFRSWRARLPPPLLCPITVRWDPARAGTGRRSGAVRFL